MPIVLLVSAPAGERETDGEPTALEGNASNRHWIFSRRRRERIGPGPLTARTIPAQKAGGNAVYGAFGAVFEWFLLEDDRIGALDEPKLCEDIEDGATTAASPEAVAELEAYTDVTLQLYQQLLEAERLASTEDFRGIWYDMGVPVGYVRILREIWLKRHK